LQLPDYVISGVEKATAVVGTRVTTTVSMGARLPEESSSVRPRFALDGAVMPPEMPGVLSPLGKGYLKASLLVGMRNWVEGDVGVAGQTLPSAYLGNLSLYSPRQRLFIDPYNLRATRNVGFTSGYDASGSYARDVSKEGIFLGTIELENLRFKRIDVSQIPAEPQVSKFSISAQTTAITLNRGELAGKFDYGFVSLKGGISQAGSSDQLCIVYTRTVGAYSFENKAVLNSEAVGEDSQSHNLLAVKTKAYRRLGENVNFMLGLNGYVGKAAISEFSLTSPWISTSVESTAGIQPLVALDWLVPFGGVARIAYEPEVEYIPYSSVLISNPMLVTWARGATVESIYRFLFGYCVAISNTARFGVDIETRADHSKPYLTQYMTDGWMFTSRRSEATITSIHGDFDLPRRMGLGTKVRFTDERTVDDGVTGDAPYVSPVEVGAEFTMPMGEKWTLAQDLTFKSKAPTHFDGNQKTKNSTIWNASLRWKARPSITADFGIHNLLDQPDQAPIGYEADRLAVWAKIEWRGNTPFGH